MQQPDITLAGGQTYHGQGWTIVPTGHRLSFTDEATLSGRRVITLSGRQFRHVGGHPFAYFGEFLSAVIERS